MRKPETLTRNGDFCRIYRRGKSFSDPLLVTYVMKSRSSGIRVGVTASKKIGNAVKRNRARRLVKEAYRLIKPGLRPGFDLVFVCRAKTSRSDCGSVMNAMQRHLAKAGLLQDAQNPQ
ncbi:MAG: ribonuclease P protein component [Clostridia bacterium]|nr:ribonuclease P protein component [Clostridia bacterium]